MIVLIIIALVVLYLWTLTQDEHSDTRQAPPSPDREGGVRQASALL